MNSLEVHFIGPVRRPGPERQLDVDKSELGTVGDLLRSLGYEEREMAVLAVVSDGARLHHTAPLQGVTRVEILVAIGGG